MDLWGQPTLTDGTPETNRLEHLHQQEAVRGLIVNHEHMEGAKPRHRLRCPPRLTEIGSLDRHV